MKTFRFPLRPVAVLRAHRQARARLAFAASARAYVKAEEYLATIRAQRHELEVILHDGRRCSFKAADEISFWNAYRRVCAEGMKAERQLIEARTAMEQRRQEYMEAHRAVRVVEKLEQRARTLHQRASEREAQLELDELAGYRVARRLAASTVAAS